MRIALCLLAVLVCFPPLSQAATYYVSTSGSDSAAGSEAAPWRTIQHAADSIKPGDTVLIGPGTYRESIIITRSGTPEAPITISALPGARVVITGADLLKSGWSKAEGLGGAVYGRDWPHVFAINHRNGKPVLTHPSDKVHELTGRTEQVIQHGLLLRQVLHPRQLAPGTFCADVEAAKLYVWLRDSGDPSKTEVEASVRSTWLVGLAPSSHIRLRGLTFRYAANFAQRGAFAIGKSRGAENRARSRGWLVEDCVFERANATGGSFAGENHLFRRCVFQDNGQIGFGASYCHDTLMEQCGFYRNNTKGYDTGWEAGGLKVCLSRGFVFDRCRAVGNHGVGIWYDIGNEKSEVKNCFIADNDEAGLFYEISYGLHAHDNLVVNNANLGQTPGHAWGNAGITLSSSEDCIVENNTLVSNRDGIALREQERSTPRIDGAKSVRIINKNHLIRNNIVAFSQAYNVAFWMDTNFFGPHPSGEDKDRPAFEDPKTLSIRLENNLLWPLPGRPNYLYGAAWRKKSQRLADPAAFAAASGLADSSKVGDPLFTDPLGGDYRLRSGSPADAMGAGLRAGAAPSRSPGP